jgi:hypothetical protein
MIKFKIRTSKIIKNRARYAAVNYDMPDDPDLTRSDKDLLVFLGLMSGKKGYCWPRIDYICVGLDLNPVTNHRHIRRRLAKLEAMGYITRDARYDNRTTGRQMSNRITINYVSSVKSCSQDNGDKNAPPININIYNLPLKEKIYKKENSPRDAWTYPQVRLVYGWQKRGPSRGSGFKVMRSNSLVRGLARLIYQQNTSKWKNLLAENKNNQLAKPIGGRAMTLTADNDLDDLFAMEKRQIPEPEKLSTILVDKPVDDTPKEALDALHVGKVSWTDICANMNRLNDQFQHWNMRLYMNGLRGQTLELFAETPFFRDTCQHRFGEDLLRTCKKLGYPVKFVNIKLRER